MKHIILLFLTNLSYDKECIWKIIIKGQFLLLWTTFISDPWNTTFYSHQIDLRFMLLRGTQILREDMEDVSNPTSGATHGSSNKKSFKTKFMQEQKDRMKDAPPECPAGVLFPKWRSTPRHEFECSTQLTHPC